MNPTLLGMITQEKDDGSIEWPEITTATFVGITVAIAGNVLISLALNIQKLAHKRQDAEKASRALQQPEGSRTPVATTSAGVGSREELESVTEDDDDQTIGQRPHSPSPNPWADVPEQERESLLPAADTEPPKSNEPSPVSGKRRSEPLKPSTTRKPSVLGRVFGFGRKQPQPDERTPLIPVDIVTEDAIAEGLHEHLSNGNAKREDHKNGFDKEDRNESDYLKSKLWWLGFVLMNVGEMGNFISYAFAPASVVAPLGTFALIANCIFAPLMLGERFHKLDFFGIAVAIVGAVTVVLSA